MSLGEIVGDTLVRADGTEVGFGSIAEDIKLFGILFTDSEDPGCKAFAPVLEAFYRDINEDSKKFEVIVCSLDRERSGFVGSFPEVAPWLAIPFGAERRDEVLEAYEPPCVPTLTVVRPSGDVVAPEADTEVSCGPVSFEKWVSM
mmetsp:Transcript_66890/g.207156  ORF Transcript_66890/g.207156 Transcript_66890/m.207156 type:complete len:145 (+) Transcript_66890:111-545(+)